MKRLLLYGLFALTLCSYGCIKPDQNTFFGLTPGDEYSVNSRVSRSGAWIAFNLFVQPLDAVLDESQPGNYIYWPSDDMWRRFGDNAGNVKSAYKELVYDMAQVLPKSPYGEYSTIFATGALRVVADREFNGVPAGDDLTAVFTRIIMSPFSKSLETEHVSLEFEDIDSLIDYASNNCVSLIQLQLRRSEELPEVVNLTFTLPVRRVLLLKWLNDRLDNESATVSYIDDEIEWKCVINDGSTS